MNASALRERITHKLLRQIDQSEYPSVTMLDRAEVALATPDDLSDYAETLVKKVEATQFPSTEMLNRLDGLVERLEQIERRQGLREQEQDEDENAFVLWLPRLRGTAGLGHASPVARPGHHPV